jgi:hypothetical protein
MAMGIRQAIQENRQVGIVVTVVLLAVGGIAIFYQVRGLGSPRPIVPEYYFTTDDGQTLFAESAERVPPFDRGGKQAVRAYVFKCSGKQFVGYLERYTEETRRLMMQADEAVKNARPGERPPPIIAQAASAARAGREVKRPGDASWVLAYSSEGTKVTGMQCPPGQSGEPEPVAP